MCTRTGNVLIGGGSGFIGRAFGKALQADGYNVVNISRMPGANNISWTKIESSGLPIGTHAVINTAGQAFMDLTKAWSPGFKQNVQNSRVFTTRALANAINQAHLDHKPKVFLIITGVGAYEPSETAKYDESSPVTGTDFFSNLVREMEGAAKVNPPVRLVIIRSGAVLGRDGGMIKNMIVPFFFGLGGRIASGKQYLPWIHIEDLVRLMKFAIENEQVSGILNGVAPQVITNEQFTKSFAKALHRSAPLPVPEKVLNFFLDPERAMIMTKGQHVTPKRVLEYGFKYDYPDIDSACQEFAYLLQRNSHNKQNKKSNTQAESAKKASEKMNS